MNRKTILPILAATLMAGLPLPASALDLPRNGATFLLAEDDGGIYGYWRRIDGRWMPFWAVHRNDRLDDDDDDDRWDDDRWDDDDGDDNDEDDDWG
ncbi:hypothetical protein [Devosia nitrariae]|uniref:DUF2502 domain-containing protein n=1 Tax=Devosia nitrariae TaxID=2071872 RepID=A0ABQ5VYJ5_9HYPH|nr:hypothetical protein [Devosia nitrariae]GLQ52843.1 hypothetical protein GCM10010862_01010 [Devosia nitrariae]